MTGRDVYNYELAPGTRVRSLIHLTGSQGDPDLYVGEVGTVVEVYPPGTSLNGLHTSPQYAYCVDFGKPGEWLWLTADELEPLD